MSLLGDEFLSKALILSLISYAIIYLKGIPKIIWSRVRRLIIFSVTIEQTDELFDYMERWLKDNHGEKYRNVLANINYRNFAIDGYGGGLRDISQPSREDVKEIEEPEEPKEIVTYRHNIDTIIIKRGGVYIKIGKGRDKLENAKTTRDLFFDKFHIEIFFFKSKMLKFLDEVVEYNQQFKPVSEKTINIYGFHYEGWTRIRELRPKSVGNIILPAGVSDGILEDATRFIGSRQWYLDRSILYKRGYLFHGDPGNGKTTFALALAHYLRRDIYTFSLSEIIGDNVLKNLFKGVRDNSVMLLEDVDASFKERKSEGTGISFSTLLNCIDGIYYKEGIIIIMTTNHIDRLDPALIRAGRIDMSVEFINPEEAQVKSYYELFFDKKLNGERLHFEPESMAQIQNICLSKSAEEARKHLFECN